MCVAATGMEDLCAPSHLRNLNLNGLRRRLARLTGTSPGALPYVHRPQMGSGTLDASGFSTPALAASRH